MFDRKRVASGAALLALSVAASMALSACSSSKSADWAKTGSAGASGSSSASPSSGPAAFSVVPAASAKNVSPDHPIVVTAGGSATVGSVTVTAGSKKISGKLSDDGKTWTSTTQLRFNTTYTVQVESAGVPATTSTFTTVKPTKTVTPHLIANALNALRSGETYGVGEPVMVHFAHAIPTSQRSAIVNALTVTSSPAVEGRWHWVSSQQVDYRGENYWPAHATVTVKANLYGVKLANGVYGDDNASATIKIGDKHYAVADNKTHTMKVYVNDKLVKTVPVSMGMGGSTRGAQGELVNYWTRSGPHVVIQKSPSVTMSSASYGITDPKSPFFYAPETVREAVRISYSGEFVHLRTWTVGDIGKRNTSHGCINVGDAYASYMYGLLRTGDIVDVTGTPVKVSFANTVADWAIPWSKW